MRYENTYNQELVIIRMIASLPRNRLSRPTSRSFNASEEESSDNDEPPDDTSFRTLTRPVAKSAVVPVSDSLT